MHYLKQEYAEALVMIERAIPHESGVFGMPVIAEHNFFYSLILAANCRGADRQSCRGYLKQIKINQKKMAVWAKTTPSNCEHKYILVQAEVFSITKNSRSIQYYERAIESAYDKKYVFEQALSSELLAGELISQNKIYIAKAHVQTAFYLYTKWGARGKAQEIANKYSEFLLPETVGGGGPFQEMDSDSLGSLDTLDLKTVLKVSQNISGEIELSNLTKRLLQITIENAGAQRGYLILMKNDSMYIVARGDNASTEFIENLPVENCDTISIGILNYVRITKEIVVINDTSEENQFQSDPYFAQNKPKSILCMPVFRQNNLLGIIYLENDLMTEVFTHKRLGILKHLSTQAMISLENALYVNEIKMINQILEEEIARHEKTEEALRVSEERFALAARGANAGLWDWDLRGNEIYFSPRWKAMLGYSEDEISRNPEEWFNRIHAKDIEMLKSTIDSYLEGAIPYFECEYRMQHKDGQYLWMLTSGLAVRDQNDSPYRLAGSQTEVTKRKIAEEQLRHHSLHDALTDLPNWTLLLDRIEHAIRIKKRQPEFQFCCLFLDIDKFKVINDSHGHETGNEILLKFASLLESSLRPGDTIARLSGDEFGILLSDSADVNEVMNVIHRIFDKLSVPIYVKEQEFFITVSIGVVMSVSDYDRPEDVLRDADTAMHRAKMQGRNRYEIFDKTMHSHVVNYVRMENELRKAIEKKEFVVCFQPIISLETGRIVSAEALLRWPKSDGQLMTTEDFIRIAEENGLIVPIGEWVLLEACRQAKEWRRAGLPRISVAVNLSARQFEQENLSEKIDRILSETGFEPENLELELTESVLMKNIEQAIVLLKSLYKKGIKTSIDDFGTGYSSLNYLKQLPVQKLKIDKSFIRNLAKGSGDEAIVRAIIAMGTNMNMILLAEGVEDQKQLLFLKEQGCHEVQGYYVSKPMIAEEFIEFCKSDKLQKDFSETLLLK